MAEMVMNHYQVPEERNGVTLEELMNVDSWQRLQDLLADVFGIGVKTVDQMGNNITKPSNTPKFCSDVMVSSPLGARRCRRCAKNILRSLHNRLQDANVPCPTGLRNAVVALHIDDNPIAYVIIGPAHLSHPLSPEECHSMAEDFRLDPDEVIDALSQIPVLSYSRIQAMADLVEYMCNTLLKSCYNRLRLQQALLELLRKHHLVRQIDSSSNLDQLVHWLIEAALQFLKPEYISVMLVDEKSDELVLKAARGLDEDIVKKARVRMGEGIAGLAALHRRSMLIHDTTREPEIRQRFRKPHLRSAMVVPIEVDDRIMGVINVSRESEGERFTEDDLAILKHLVKCAGETLMTLHTQNNGNE